MNCQEALSLLYEIIDKEASEIDTREVREHVENCQHCFEVYRLETSVHEFITAKLQGDNPAPSLEALRTRLRGRLDEIDGQQILPEKRPFFRRTAALLAAAASLVILIGGGMLLSDLYHQYTVYGPFVKAHGAATDNLGAFTRDNQTFTNILQVRDELGYAIQPAVDTFIMIGATTEEIMGAKIAHFVYCCSNGTVSVLVVPADVYEIPAELEESKVVRGDVTFFAHQCRGCRLVYHRVGQAIVITATRDRSVDLTNFVPGRGAI